MNSSKRKSLFVGTLLIWADLAQSLCSPVSGDGSTLIADITAQALLLADDVYVDDGLALLRNILMKRTAISKWSYTDCSRLQASWLDFGDAGNVDDGE